jgi:hypothetical protein
MKKGLLAAVTVFLAVAAPSSAGEVRGTYIVVFKPGAVANVPAAAQELASAHEGALSFVYQHALEGFAVELPAGRARALEHDPRVAYVEADQPVQAFATQSPATWGLDRVDQRNLPLNNTYNYNQTGSGVHAYIIDTGVRGTHQEFSGRMGNGFTAINDGGGTTDCNGHGTHVAGTTGGTTYGVAKQVRIHPVRVLNCQGSGTNSGVIAGVDWVTSNHVKPAVANMSLGGGASSALDTAVNNSINAGVSYAIAAGNDNANACNYSPARVANAVTVGSTTSSDARSSFSNFGSCLDIFAPGSSITSAWSTSDTATNTISGTSMATPHTAGGIALYLQTNPGASPATVTQALINNATTGVVTSPGSGSPNRLLYTLFGGGGGGDTTPPTTSITSPANGATVSGTVTVSASASDNVGVSRVELFVDGSLHSTDTSSPYSFSWNTTTVANGSHNLQTRAYDAAGNSGSSSVVSVNVSNASGSELISNGGFEGSSSPWTLSGDAYWSTGAYPHSGTGYTVLGFYDFASGTMYQTVSIPSGHPANYTFWLNVTSDETTTTTVYDRLFVEVRNTSGSLLATLATYSNLNKTSLGSYSQKSFSLASWRGQTVRVQFRATTDSTLPTSFRIDDVSVR